MNNDNKNLNVGINSNDLNNMPPSDLNTNNSVISNNNITTGTNIPVTNNINNNDVALENQNIQTNITNNVTAEPQTTNNTVLYDTSAHISNVQVQKPQTKKATIKISYELKTAIIILIILLVIIIFIPKIFDLFY